MHKFKYMEGSFQRQSFTDLKKNIDWGLKKQIEALEDSSTKWEVVLIIF